MGPKQVTFPLASRSNSFESADSDAAVTRTPSPSPPFWVETMIASSPISRRTRFIASAMVAEE